MKSWSIWERYSQETYLYKGLGLECRPYLTRTFISKAIYFHSLKILSTKDGQHRILKFLLLTLKKEVVFPSSHHTVYLKVLTIKGWVYIYVIIVFVCHCSNRALSFLCPILSYQTILTFFWPAMGCEARLLQWMNLYLCMKVVDWRLLNYSSAMQWYWF